MKKDKPRAKLTKDGLRRVAMANGQLHVFSDTKRIVLQLRTESNELLQPCVKVGVELSRRDCRDLATELIRVLGSEPMLESGSP